MISMLRVDDRLIHGQVAVKWSKELEINRIMVVSDSIAKNDIQVSALKMAAPSDVKVAILPLDKSINILNDPRSKKLKILVITNEMKYITGLFQKIIETPVLDIANYGRIGGAISEKKKISETVYFSQDDKKRVKDLIEGGIKVIYQPLPSDSAKPIQSLMGGI